MKLLVIYRGNEGSSYLVNRLSQINILHDLGFEVFDRYKYIMKNINKEDIFEHLTECFYTYTIHI